MIPKSNEIYRHFKGNLYKVLTVATHSETGEKMVVYQALYGSFPIYCRPLEMFISKVDRDKYPNVSQEYRFEKVEEILDLSKDNEGSVNREIVVEPMKDVVVSEAVAVSEEEEFYDEEDFDDDDEFQLDPLVMEFLDAESIKEKKNILASLHHRITEDMIYTLALAMDIVIDEGNLEERYEQLMYCLNTKEKYEIERQ